MKDDPRFPDWLALVTLWLKTHYAGTPCVVFSAPREAVQLLQRHYLPREMDLLLMADYAILPCKDVAEASSICHGNKRTPFSMTWNGTKITGENT